MTRGVDDGDEAVVARVVRGDTSAFEILMRRHNQRVFRVVRGILRSDDEAEDAMQEAYVSAFTHIADFGGRSSFSTWLVRIAIHEAFARLRRMRPAVSLDEEALEEEPMAKTRTPEEVASDVELRALLDEAVDGLPIAFRTVFVLRAVEDMSSADTAEVLGIAEETVRTRLHRARGLLRDHLSAKLEAQTPSVYAFHLSRCDRVVAGVLARIDERPDEPAPPGSSENPNRSHEIENPGDPGPSVLVPPEGPDPRTGPGIPPDVPKPAPGI